MVILHNLNRFDLNPPKRPVVVRIDPAVEGLAGGRFALNEHLAHVEGGVKCLEWNKDTFFLLAGIGLFELEALHVQEAHLEAFVVAMRLASIPP